MIFESKKQAQKTLLNKSICKDIFKFLIDILSIFLPVDPLAKKVT